MFGELDRRRSRVHVPEVRAQLPHGDRFFEHGHRTVPFRAAQQVHRALFDPVYGGGGRRVFRAAVTDARRRPSRARRPAGFRRQPDDVRRARVERRGRVERQRLGWRRPVHFPHFERVVAVLLQQTIRRAVQLDVIACSNSI